MNAKKFSALLLIGFLLIGGTTFSQKKFAPKDLAVPVFDSIHFIIDPEKKIIDEWYREIIGTRETYFFARYIEPICVRVDNIKDPSDPEAYADKLVALWDLENKTNGRYIFQLCNKSNKKIVFRIGTKLKDFYSKQFISELTADIEDIHFSGKATGTGDFVAIQKMGANIFREIAYESAISTYDNNNSKHNFYPDKVEKSYGELKVSKKPIYSKYNTLQDDASIETVLTPDKIEESSKSENEPKNYYSGITQAEINQNFAAINTAGTITSINAVPNAREIDNTHVTDPHFLLSEFGKNQINSLLNQLEDSLGYQVAVVCLNSIGDNDPRTWATDLFNHWGVGSKESENGLLMLLVHDQHAIEFITGRGTEGVLTDIDCYNIQQNEMIPYFKKDDYVTAMIRGTEAVCDFFYGAPPLYSSSTSTATNYEEDSYYDDYAYVPRPWYESDFMRIYFGICILLMVAWVICLLIAHFVKDLHKRYHIMKFFSLLLWPIAFPVPYSIVYFINRGFMERWRNTERFSPTTGEMMRQLDDVEEDKHLAKGQLSEEKIKSIDYDVWVSYGGKEVLVLAYKKWFSKYNKCISCKYKTYFQVYNKTITSPTYTSTGTGEKLHKCENCGHSQVTRYTIPKRTKSSSSSSSSGGYRSGFSSGGSSGGSSYGGGSSRGRGAGSRW